MVVDKADGLIANERSLKQRVTKSYAVRSKLSIRAAKRKHNNVLRTRVRVRV